jgi:hypothetical protein
MTTNLNNSDDREPDALPDMGETPPLTEGELTEALGLAEARLSALDKIIKKHEIDRDAKVASTRERLTSVQALSNAQRESAMVEETSRAHREAVKASDAARVERLRELEAIERRVRAVEPLFASPVVMLGREALGDPVRTQLEQQLAGAGPATLRNYALLAVAGKNRKLGAALIAAVDRMPAARRPFSTQDLATKLVGADWQKLSGTIRAVRNRVQEAVLRNRSFERGQPLNPTSKIALGLAKRGERAASDA